MLVVRIAFTSIRVCPVTDDPVHHGAVDEGRVPDSIAVVLSSRPF